MHRPALARLYRPRRFSEIIGQDHVSATLRTAVERGRVAHAYLFCGPRGVGKTTAARVLAMALNCADREDGEPCGKCESCDRIWSGKTSLDVVEIDAASNRGVDDARDLRERAMYAPSGESRYKVYIIDEAHMLTREAWNAFLKIFEEPPPRVIFVLATTEPGKILQAAPPILSRCQRFDFRRIATEQIRARMVEVLSTEGVEAEEAALVPISRKAEGALRDALSSLDQVLAFSGTTITADDVRRVLGLIEEETFFELFEILTDRRAADVFGFVDRLVDDGYDLEEFQRGLGDSLRLLLRAKLEGADALEAVASHLTKRYAELAERFDVGDLLRMLSALAEFDTDGRFRKSEQQRILIEVLLLRFAMLDRTVDLERLIEAAGSAEEPAAKGATGSGGGEGAKPIGRRRATEQRSGKTGRPSAPLAPPAPGGDSVASAKEAWHSVIADGQVLRPGQGIALRAVQVTDLRPDGELVVAVGVGTPGSEVLAEAVTRRRLEEELSGRLGRPIRISIVEPTAGRASRVSEDSSRKQKLERLVEGDEDLQQLVEKLDLEIVD